MPRRIDVERLFEETVTVFAERGYRATTTREIARRAGINEVTLFRRYGDKAALINAAGVIAAHQERGQLTAGEPTQKLATLIAPLMAFGRWARTCTAPVVPEFEASVVVSGFLDGHRSTECGASVMAPR